VEAPGIDYEAGKTSTVLSGFSSCELSSIQRGWFSAWRSPFDRVGRVGMGISESEMQASWLQSTIRVDRIAAGLPMSIRTQGGSEE
jgi:hypothetical protein